MKIAFRLDASNQIGTGHFMRCLTLADALSLHRVQIRFISRHLPPHLRAMLDARSYQFVVLDNHPQTVDADGPDHAYWLGTSQDQDATDSIAALSDQSWDWLVIDHYALDARWETRLRNTVRRIFVIDDLADRRHDCDVLLDQNSYADRDTRYDGKLPSHCRLLLGPRYVLLRAEFRQLHEQIKERGGTVRRVLIFFGGVDADNYTAVAIDAITEIEDRDFHIDVVIGAQHPARADIEAMCSRHGYVCHVQTAAMAQLMARADMAIGAGGTATWERCCLGLPTLTLCIAANQRKLVDDSALSGLIYAPMMAGDLKASLLHHLQALLDNPALRTLVSRQGIHAVDGRGALRVLRTLEGNSVKIRRANENDFDDLMAWRNHPSVCAVSRCNEPIGAAEHERWLHRVLQDPNCALLIGYRDEQQAVGVVRFDMQDNVAEVSIYLVPGLTDQGFGAALLVSAEQWLCSHQPDIGSMRAEILGNNALSHRLFKADGFSRNSTHYSKRLQQA